MIEARYKIMSSDLIRRYSNEQASIDEIGYIFKYEFNKANKIEELTGGRVSSVYRINFDGHDKVVKFSKGVYRITELKREAEVLSHIINQGYMNIVPKVDSFIILDKIAYIVEDYFNGNTVREELRVVENVQERLKIWEEIGKILSSIHMLCQDKDEKSEWLMGQLNLARINMENNLLDYEEFKDQAPKNMLKLLISKKPKRNQVCLLHGDFRTKNIMINKESKCKVIDRGFVDIGDPYYDLAIIDYYFKDDLDRKSFYRGYTCNQYDKDLIEFYDRLSKFINV